jgi:hypothetical protein
MYNILYVVCGTAEITLYSQFGPVEQHDTQEFLPHGMQNDHKLHDYE